MAKNYSPELSLRMSLAVTEPKEAPATEPRPQRIEALDWTKGALILCMVLYHSINYSAFRPLAFRFLAFLPPSFILITGFLVGQVYAEKYDLDTWKPYARLAVRGLKLLLIFAFLNFSRSVFVAKDFMGGVDDFAERAGAIFLSGNGRLGIFEVLLPIAYFLLIAPVLLWVRSRAKGAVFGCAAVVFLLSFFLELSGNPLKNLEFVAVGVLGMAFGLFRREAIDGLARKWIPVLLLYGAYRICSYIFGEVYAVQTLAAVVTVLLLYCIALHVDLSFWWTSQTLLMGRYSLFGYLAQIAVLQGAVKLVGGKPQHVFGVFVTCTLTVLVTFLLIKGLDRFRQRNRFVGFAYKAVFA